MAKPGKTQISQQEIYDYLMSKPKMTRNKALGIMANIKAESDFYSDAVEIGDMKNKGIGLFQHTYPSRKKEFVEKIPDWETNWKAQIDFALSESEAQNYINTTYSTPEEAVKAFMIEFENPKDQSEEAINRRVSYSDSLNITPVDEADVIETNEEEYPTITSDDVSEGEKKGKFRVQLMVGKQNVSADILKNMSKLGNIEKTQQGTDMYIYHSLDFETQEEADIYLAKAKLSGFENAFIPSSIDKKSSAKEEVAEDIMGDLSLEPVESVEASTRVVDSSIQSQIDNGSLIDNGDGTYTRTNEDGSQEVLIQSLDADGNSELIPREEGEPVPEGSVVTNIPQHPSKNLDVDNDGILDVIDPIDNRVVTEVEVEEEVSEEEVSEEAVVEEEPVVVIEEESEDEGLFNKLKTIGGGVGAIAEGVLGTAGTVLDAVGGPSAIISYVMGRKGLEAAMKEVKPMQAPELSPLFHQHLRQSKELAKRGFHPSEAKKYRKEIDNAYQRGLENSVRGTAGDRAKFLAQSGVLDSQRSSALLDFAAQDAELQRANQGKYTEQMLFKENFDMQRSNQLRTEDMQRQLADKQAASQFTATAFSSLMSNIGGGNTALIKQILKDSQVGGTTNIGSTIDGQ